MSTATLTKTNKAYGAVSTLMGGFSLSGDPTITNLKQVIKITTDKKSANDSGKLLTALTELRKSLPVNEVKDLKELERQQKLMTDNVVGINQVFEVINTLFENEKEVKIDDPNMQQLISNLHEAREIMLFVADYLKLVLDVDKVRKSLKTFTLEQLEETLVAA